MNGSCCNTETVSIRATNLRAVRKGWPGLNSQQRTARLGGSRGSDVACDVEPLDGRAHARHAAWSAKDARREWQSGEAGAKVGRTMGSMPFEGKSALIRQARIPGD